MHGTRGSLLRLGLIATVALAAGAGVTPGVAASRPVGTATTHTAGTIAPGPTSMMDCNGWSAKYPSPVPGMKMRCVDPIAVDGTSSDYGTASGYGCGYSSGYGYGSSGNSKFYDNCHYVGHDEPTTKFISTAPGSGNTFTFYQQLSTDPAASLTRTTSPTGSTVSDYATLSPAPWFGLPICDPNSFPNGACTPDSDTNTTTTAGSAFMELQFYPPKYGPWMDNVSMDLTKWTVALNIDSLECAGDATTGCASPNPNCVEPINFALLTHDGVPTGPPGPASATGKTFAENADTLQMNPGDTLKVSITDVPDSGSPSVGGLRAEVDDLTTGEKGFIVSSAANGFENTDNATCMGSPYSFHAEYSTASQGNQVDWAALEGGVLMEQEIGHSEPCGSVSGADAQSISADNFSDPAVMAVCNGGFEGQNGASGTGEGPCGTGQPTPNNCPGATTEGTSATACPMTGGACEQSDGFCLPAGQRTVTVNSAPEVWNQPIATCEQNQTQNGDLDFDGSPYIADWPDGSSTHPTSFRYLGPFDAAGNPYPQTQFETDAPGSENNCNPSSPTASTCKVPADGSTFYPFWSLTSRQGLDGVTTNTASPACTWNFGNQIPGITDNAFGQAAQYGSASAHYGGTLISAPVSNPAISGTCPAVTFSQVTASHFVPLSPSRVLDTRQPSQGVCTVTGSATVEPCATLGPGQSMDVQITGASDVNTGAPSGVPGDGTVTAVVMNVTAADTTGSSYFTVWPKGASRPLASNLNFTPGQVVPNLVEVPVSGDGKVSIFNQSGTADAVFDVAGYYTGHVSGSAGLFRPLPPSRIMDTRVPSPGCGSTCVTLGPGGVRTLNVAGANDINGNPSGVPGGGTAAAVVLNVTVTNPSASGFLTVWPAGQSRPTASNVNFVPDQTVPNRVIVELGSGGAISILNNAGNTDVVVDVGGYYTSATAAGGNGGYTPVVPARILDTRSSEGSCAPTCTTIAPNTTLILHVAGSSDATTGNASGVPGMAASNPPSSVVLNVTVTNPTHASFLTIYPGGSPVPVISDLNFVAGQTVPNLVVVKLDPSGNVTIYNQAGSVDVVVDVEGWYT